MKKSFLIPGLALGIAAASLPASSAESGAGLLFREDWKEISAEIPVTQEHVATPGLRLDLHGPGRDFIKKSHHDDKKNDPWYIWSGRCPMNWAVSLRYKDFADLSARGARIRWRTKQQGGRELHLLVKLPGDRWFVSDQSSPGSGDWAESELALEDLTWRHFNVITIAAEEAVDAPALEKIDEIGFTDLEPGGGSGACSRLDWIEVYGASAPRAAPKESPVKITRADATLPENVIAHEGLVYARYGEREMTLDLYLPKAAEETGAKKKAAPGETLPGVVFIHGGGFYQGSPAAYAPMAMQLAARGYVTANIEYRLAGEALFPAAIEDCKAAVRWLRAHASDYRLDPDRIGCVGGSAGGVLSGLLATSGAVPRLEGDGGWPDQSSAVQAAVVMAGSMDFTTPEALEQANADPRRRVRTFLGGTFEEVRGQYRDLSAITHVDENTPPMCFMDGEFDSPGTRYGEFRARLDKLGIRSEEHVIANGPHPFWGNEPFFGPALEIVASFFERSLE